MSANNYLKIKKENGRYVTYDCCAEKKGACSIISEWISLEMACMEAEKYQRENEVEFGIRFNIEED